MGVRRRLVIAILVLSTACSSFEAERTPLDDGGVAEGGIDASHAVDAGDAGLVDGEYVSDGFDVLDCPGWRPERMSLVGDPDVKRTGASSCRACSLGSGDEPYLAGEFPGRGPGTYRVAAFTKASSRAGLLRLELLKGDDVQATNEADWATTATFERVSSSVASSAAIDKVRVSLYLNPIAQKDDCFWVDDVRIAHVP